MKLLMCLVLIIALPILSIGSTPADSIPPSTRDSLIRGNEKQRFNLAYTSLLYWWQYAIEQEKINSHKDSIIATYVEETGLQSNNVEDLKKIIENKEMVEESICEDKIEKAVAPIEKKKKAWRKTTIIVSIVAVVEGVIIYVISFL